MNIKFLLFSLLFITIISTFFGCSSRMQHQPISGPAPEITNIDLSLQIGFSEHELLGIWTATFNVESFEATVVPNRILNAHYNVRNRIPAPIIHLNSWNPVSEIVDVDVTIRNPYSLDAYDVRLIILTDSVGHTLANPDDWTELYDIPGGFPWNPFKAYAKSEPLRRFAAMTSHTENLLVRCPSGIFTVQFAVDASYPVNCEEPYEIRNFDQDILYQNVGASTEISIDVHDWQNDVSEVMINCPAIMGANDIYLENSVGNNWYGRISNVNGVSPGSYFATIYAKSSGSGILALVDRVRITVSEGSGIPSTPQLINILHNPIPMCRATYVKGDYIYAITSFTPSYNALYVIDSADYNNVSIVGKVRINDDLKYLNIAGDRAYVSSLSAVYIVDISNPSNPVILGSLSGYGGKTSSNNTTMCVIRNYIFTTVDVSDPQNPHEVGSLPNTYLISDFAVVDDFVFITQSGQPGHFLSVSISDPTNPIIVRDIPYSNGPVNGGMDFNDDNILVTSCNTQMPGYPHEYGISYLLFIDIETRSDPRIINQIIYMDVNSIFVIISNIEVSKDILYFDYEKAWEGDFYVLDISDPSDPLFLTSYEFGNDTNISIDGSRGAYGSRIDDFIVMNTSDPSNIEHYMPLENMNTICTEIENNFACVATEQPSALHIIDILDPLQPGLLGKVYLPDYYVTADMEIKGNYLYLVNGISTCSSMIVIVDISDPNNPQIVNSVSSIASHLDAIEIMNNIAFVGESGRGVVLYDISDPLNPVETSIIPHDNASDLACRNDYLFGTQQNQYMFVADISDPDNPQTIATMSDFKPSVLDIEGNILVTNDQNAAIVVLDISDPSSPDIMGSCTYNGYYIHDLDVQGGFAYFAIKGGTPPGVPGGSQVIDVTDPSNPHVMSQLITFGEAVGISVGDNMAYLTCIGRSISNHGGYGLQINKLW